MRPRSHRSPLWIHPCPGNFETKFFPLRFEGISYNSVTNKTNACLIIHAWNRRNLEASHLQDRQSPKGKKTGQKVVIFARKLCSLRNDLNPVCYSCLIIPAAWNGRNLEAWDLVMRFVLDDNFFRMSDIKVLECTLMITHPKKPLLFPMHHCSNAHWIKSKIKYV